MDWTATFLFVPTNDGPYHAANLDSILGRSFPSDIYRFECY